MHESALDTAAISMNVTGDTPSSSSEKPSFTIPISAKITIMPVNLTREMMDGESGSQEGGEVCLRTSFDRWSALDQGAMPQQQVDDGPQGMIHRCGMRCSNA